MPNGHEQQSPEIPQSDMAGYLRAYIGKNAEKYEDQISHHTAGPNAGLKPGWCWGALVLFVGWPLYRKLWLIGGGVFVIFLSANSLARNVEPMLGILINITVPFALAIYGKSYYVRHAKSEIEKMLATATTPDEARAQIQNKGGVSIIGGILGSLPIIAFVPIAVFGLIALGQFGSPPQ